MNRPNIIKPNDRAEWLELRKSGIGASEVAAVVGISPWDTPFSLWLRKSGQIPPQEETIAMKLGHLLEPVIAQLWEEETGFRIVKASAKDIIYQDPEHPWRKCTPDRIGYEILPNGRKQKVLLEFKSTAVDIDPDDVPDHFIAQCQYQMHITGIHVCYLCWLVNGRYFGYVRLEYDKAFAEWMIGEVDKFWNENVLGGKEPELISVNDFTFKGSDPGSTIDADEETLAHLLSVVKLNAEISVAESMRDAHKDAVKLYMGEAESLTINGKAIATWKTGARGRLFLLKNKNIEEIENNNEHVSE